MFFACTMQYRDRKTELILQRARAFFLMDLYILVDRLKVKYSQLYEWNNKRYERYEGKDE